MKHLSTWWFKTFTAHFQKNQISRKPAFQLKKFKEGQMKSTHKIASCAFALCLALGAIATGGCSSQNSEGVTGTSSSTATQTTASADKYGEPALMPQSHEGRYASLGAAGCYGCHGANNQTTHMLATAPALPEDHYTDESSATQEIYPARLECITCHSQG
jgi:cytochrome c-type protein NapB